MKKKISHLHILFLTDKYSNSADFNKFIFELSHLRSK
jgi:hypothetical protein